MIGSRVLQARRFRTCRSELCVRALSMAPLPVAIGRMRSLSIKSFAGKHLPLPLSFHMPLDVNPAQNRCALSFFVDEV